MNVYLFSELCLLPAFYQILLSDAGHYSFPKLTSNITFDFTLHCVQLQIRLSLGEEVFLAFASVAALDR